ncbi:hypothetical protein PHMEG_0005664 [Phytophthora megakarya]|uniref:IPT/TIG domain-containing protein n=1 Tax=Phytophthora megakarya TaxID=4795 RepID=A0A225WSC1_9STRA|nr:hypothetical protein PHMEG_0005664 [Phytophthora megakarya]
MECSVPDFPRGVIVRVTVAMNGVEFVQCPGELRVFQSPRLTELFPNWVSTSTTVELELRGINLTAAVSTKSSGDNNRNQHDSANIQVSFTGTRGKKVVRGKCEGGHVRCLIPREILYVSTTTCRDKGRSHSATTTIFPIQVDIWLGGKHNAFTGLPLPLHVYGEIPAVHIVSPMDGPVYGGFSIVVEGNGFIDTGKIVVRFQLYTDHQETPRTEDDNPKTHQVQDSSTSKSTSTSDVRQKETTKDNSASEKNRPRISMPSTQSIQAYVDVIAKFVSSERVLCPAPSLPQEGVYAVLVALNSVEFSRVSDGSWYLAWQNWQKRKRLLSHSLFSRATAPDEIASALSSASLDEDNVDRLRKKSSFMLPKIRSALAVTPGGSPSTSSRVKRDSVAEDIVWPGDTEEMLMKKPQLLQWHPTSSMESRVNGRPLLPLLEYLCSARETQQFICRRLHVAFRLTSPHARDGNGSADAVPAVRYCVFVEAIRMIFPNAMARDLEELWQATDHRPDVKQLLRRLTRNVGPDHRSKSPEPGPTHYDPRYKFVSSREPSAIIFPPVVQPEHIVDPPSALFIDYDAATLVVKPRPPRHVFRKRKFNTSWCNPVVDAVPRSPTPPSIETSKQDAVRTPRTLAQATFASSNQRTRSPNTQKSTRESKPLTTPTPCCVPPRPTTSRQSNLSGQNPFYNDIAPLYAKFLSSTEVKRFLNR